MGFDNSGWSPSSSGESRYCGSVIYTTHKIDTVYVDGRIVGWSKCPSFNNVIKVEETPDYTVELI